MTAPAISGIAVREPALGGLGGAFVTVETIIEALGGGQEMEMSSIGGPQASQQPVPTKPA